MTGVQTCALPIYGCSSLIPKYRVTARELVRECRKYVLEFLSIEVIPGAEEACTKNPILRGHSGERLCDGRFSGSRQTIEPEDVPILRIIDPSHNTIEDRLPSPLEARVMVAGLVSRVVHRI